MNATAIVNAVNAILALVSLVQHEEPELLAAFAQIKKIWADYQAAQSAK